MRVQLAFVAVGMGVALAYALSAVLAHPDWGGAATYLVVRACKPTCQPSIVHELYRPAPD
jgi:hypothetical protein